MSINISAVSVCQPRGALYENKHQNGSAPAFKGNNAPKNLTLGNTAYKVLQNAGWILLIGLLIGGWVQSCTGKKNGSKPNQEILNNPQENPVKAADYTE